MLRAQSPQQIQVHTRLLTSHLVPPGFTLNWEKGVLDQTENITFIGLAPDLYNVEAFLSCLARFRRGALLKFRMCVTLLGVMASALAALPFGQMHMKSLQLLVSSLGLNPKHHSHHQVSVTMAFIPSCPLEMHSPYYGHDHGCNHGTVSSHYWCFLRGLGAT